MTRAEFKRLAARKILLDGAFGTEAAKAGMPEGVCPEKWALENPGKTAEILRSYAQAGSDILYAPTFGANSVKLGEYHLAERTAEINASLVKLAKAAAPGVFVFGDLSSTGRFVAPFGDLDCEDAVAIYREQTRALLSGGADGIVIETMMDLQEARAALIGARENPGDFPVVVTMTFETSGKTLTGCDPVASLVALQALGADAFGCNCSGGPVEMAELLATLKPFAAIPLVAKPNAGIPRLQNGETVFPLGPVPFAECAQRLFDAGAALFGGCCGTTPEHIAALKNALEKFGAPFRNPAPVQGVVSGCGAFRVLASDAPFAVIGERINPTGKKALQAELREGRTDLVFDFALQQTRAGAALLDVNMGMAGIDEKAMMLTALKRILKASPLPLSIDSTDPETVEAALRFYPGRALFNSISAEKSRLEKILPVAAKYGAMPILLPLTDEGIPAGGAERIAVAETLLAEAAQYGYSEKDVAVDALVMTISSDEKAAQAALDVISWAKRRKINSVCGLSNVSFGMPARQTVNRTFLGMAAGCGLNMAIANPLFPDIMETALAADALAGKDARQKNFIAHFAAPETNGKPAAAEAAISPEKKVYRAV
ncbi:MAG: homocysteine S-methyltransferase family protein, partial [Victivallaceae bacterium]|nr:homocysteine S-methyltransferase family protein [Victivallaceae bacterium]